MAHQVADETAVSPTGTVPQQLCASDEAGLCCEKALERSLLCAGGGPSRQMGLWTGLWSHGVSMGRR